MPDADSSVGKNGMPGVCLAGGGCRQGEQGASGTVGKDVVFDGMAFHAVSEHLFKGSYPVERLLS
mgnify:CR=1 FL=1